MAAYKDTLRSLALNDEQFVNSVLGMGHDTVDASGLDPKTHALLRLEPRWQSTLHPAPTSRSWRWRRRRAPPSTRSWGA